MRGGVLRAAGGAGRADPAALAGERHQQLVAAAHAGETVGEDPAVEVAGKLALDKAGEPGAVGAALARLAEEGSEVLAHGAFGFYSAAALLALVYLCCSGIHVPLEVDRCRVAIGKQRREDASSCRALVRVRAHVYRELELSLGEGLFRHDEKKCRPSRYPVVPGAPMAHNGQGPSPELVRSTQEAAAGTERTPEQPSPSPSPAPPARAREPHGPPRGNTGGPASPAENVVPFPMPAGSLRKEGDSGQSPREGANMDALTRNFYEWQFERAFMTKKRTSFRTSSRPSWKSAIPPTSSG